MIAMSFNDSTVINLKFGIDTSDVELIELDEGRFRLGFEIAERFDVKMNTLEEKFDLKIDAAITAWLALSAAQDNDRVPFKPGLPKKGTKPLY